MSVSQHVSPQGLLNSTPKPRHLEALEDPWAMASHFIVVQVNFQRLGEADVTNTEETRQMYVLCWRLIIVSFYILERRQTTKYNKEITTSEVWSPPPRPISISC